MIKNISLGVYYPGDSLLHRLQARTKLLVLLWLFVFLTIANHREWHFAPYILVGLLVIAATGLSGVSFRHMWQRMWLLVHGIILIFSFLLTLCMPLLFLPILPLRHLRKHRWLRRVSLLLVLIELIALVFYWFTRDAAINSTLLVGPVDITHDGVWLEMSFFVVFLVLYAFSLLLTMTTTPIALVEGMTILLTPLRWLRLPVDDFALMTLIALRF